MINNEIEEQQELALVPTEGIQMANMDSLTWPVQLEPCFVIQTCFNCREH